MQLSPAKYPWQTIASDILTLHKHIPYNSLLFIYTDTQRRYNFSRTIFHSRWTVKEENSMIEGINPSNEGNDDSKSDDDVY